MRILSLKEQLSSNGRGGTALEARIRVRLTPKAGRDEIVGWQTDAHGDGVLRVRVTAPPVDGKANAALEALISKALRVPKSRVSVASGAKARDKVIAIDGIDEAAARTRLECTVQ